MELRITHFSQDYSLVDPNEGKFYLVVETADGRTARLPVLKETTEALIKLAFVSNEAPIEDEQEPETDEEEMFEEEDVHDEVEASSHEETDEEELEGPLLMPPIVNHRTQEVEPDEDGVASL